VRFPRRKLAPTVKPGPDQQWRIDYARNEWVNTAGRRVPIRPGEVVAGIAPGPRSAIYQREGR
jgi:hypothetical protein